MRDVWTGHALPDDVMSMKLATRELVDRKIMPHEVQMSLDGQLPESIHASLQSLGYFGLTIPEEHGGFGASHLAYCAVLEELSRAPKQVWLPVSIANGVAARLLQLSAIPEQQKRYLPGIAAGEIVPAIAVTEPDAGSDVQGLRTRAKAVDGGFLINGSKHYITHGDRADVLFLLVRTGATEDGSRSFSLLLVDKGTPGLAVAGLQETMSGPAVDQAELTFDDCFVPQENLLGEVGRGLKYVFQTFAEERVSMAITALGTARRALELAVDYANTRKAFGSTIGTYQAVQIHLADSATELAAASSMTYALAGQLGARHVIPAEAAMVKLYASEMAGRVADRCLQVFGGYGYMAEAPISRIYRDVRVMRISGGTSEIQRSIIAKALLQEDT